MIRTGQSSGKIRVTVANHNMDGYQVEKYGDSITVERTLGATGGFKLFGHDGKEKSRAKKDLEEMMDVL
jgi:hypothetical protein